MKLKPFASVIMSYKERHYPYSTRKDYKHYIDSLAAELRLLKDEPWSLESEKFDSYTYVICNPLKKSKGPKICPSGFVINTKYEIFYVGKGIKERAYDHLKEAEDKTNTNYKCNTVRKIWKAGKKPKIIIMPSRVSNYVACAFEIDLIAGLGRKNNKTGYLTNLTDGGEGVVGRIPTKVWCINHSRAMSGRSFSTEHRRNIGRSNKNKKVSEKTKCIARCERVPRLEICGIKYDSVRHAAKLLAVSRVVVLRWLRDGLNSAKIITYGKAMGKARAVIIDGITYTSITKASEKLKITRGMISHRIKSQNYTNYLHGIK